MKILMFIILFLLIGAFSIISNENIRMNTSENANHFFSLYSQWFDKLIGNSRTMTGYVFKLQWLPGGG